MEQRSTALVTGGGTGIGRAIATLLANDGWHVVVVGRREAPLRELAQAQPGIVAIQGDVTVPDEVARITSQIVDVLGTVDAVVANAGGTHHGELSTLSQVADHWLRMLAQNVLSAVLVEHALRPHLRRPGGRVVAISSFSARTPAGNAAYGASKAALNRWVLALGDELGAIGGTANAVAPGFVPATELAGEMDPARVERVGAGIGVRRHGTPEEVADAVRWLVSPGAAFVNGTVVEVDGGHRRRD